MILILKQKITKPNDSDGPEVQNADPLMMYNTSRVLDKTTTTGTLHVAVIVAMFSCYSIRIEKKYCKHWRMPIYTQ